MTNWESRAMKAYRHLHRKGPFGLFLQKLEASRDPEIVKVVKSYQDEVFTNAVFFHQIAGHKDKAVPCSEAAKLQVGRNGRFSKDSKHDEANGHGGSNVDVINGREDDGDGCASTNKNGIGEDPQSSKQVILEDPTRCQRNTLLNYYLFKQLSDKKRKKYSKVFRKRYNVPLTNGFCQQYLAVEKPEKFRKTSFLLWLNAYLRDNVSTELLRLSSFEIALKAGDAWNALPNDEKKKWYKLLNQDMHRKKF